MPSFEKTIGVFGGLNGQSRSLYWNCPTCGMPYFDKCSTNPTPLTTACDLNHGTDGPTQFEVSWASIPLGGKITIDRQEILITEAFCFLFNGNLEIEFHSRNNEGECGNLPFGDAVDFSELSGQTKSIADCLNATYEDPLLKPSFTIDRDSYSISSLNVDTIHFMHDANLLSLRLGFEARHNESDALIHVQTQLVALCRQVEKSDLLSRFGPIPVRFAKTYLPLLGLPEIMEGATRETVVSLFGEPNHEGGGNHTILGITPKCVRYTFPSFYLHFQMESGVITQITIMPRVGPWAVSFPE